MIVLRKRVRGLVGLTAGLVAGLVGASEPTHVLGLEGDINWSAMTCGKAGCRPRPGFSVGGNRFLLGGKERGDGIGTYAPSVFDLDVGGHALRFTAQGAADDIATGEVVFNVYCDGRLAATSGPLVAGRKPHPFDVDLRGVRTVRLEVAEGRDGNAGDVADWIGPQFTFKTGTYPMNDVRMASPQLGILTPPPGKAPRINGATVLGVRPGHPILFKVPVTGEQPLKVDVEKVGKVEELRELGFDPATRILSGKIDEPGEYKLVFKASNAKGAAERGFTIKVGDTLALTPPMGFNSWNCHQVNVTDEKMRRTADALVAMGLVDHGYQYVVIDDFWMRDGETGWPEWHAGMDRLHGPMRDAQGRILPNRDFPDMKGLADSLHARGLKAGLYSSPGPLTCGSCAGSWRHEKIDAETFAAWGFDFLKYDWCSYGEVCKGEKAPECGIRPYRLMGAFLKAQDRDILFSLCQYGMWDVWTWAKDVDGQMWRMTGDVFDAWRSVEGAIARLKKLWHHAGPGRWNDPDMLVVGPMCWNKFRGSRLAPNEQYTHLSMWAMCAAPLMIGCDLGKADALTLSLLSNDEVLAIDQDELGAAAACVEEGDDWEVWARPLADGSIAAALFNKALRPQRIALDPAKLGLEGPWAVRDVWRQRDDGIVTGKYEVEVFGHATHLIRLTPRSGGRLREGLKDIRLQTPMRF